MLTADQQAALRVQAKSDPACADAYAVRDLDALAVLLSVGRTRHGATQIGVGTIMAVLGADRGAEFLDSVESLGATDRAVYWGFDPVRRGVLDLRVPAAVASLGDLKAKLPDYALDIDRLLQIGVEPDQLSRFDVMAALFNDDGSVK